MARVLYLPGAMDDLRQIWSYFAQQSQSLEKADRLIDSIDDAAIPYARNPELGEARPELAKELRCFAVGRYVAFYRLHSDGIEVVQIIHGSRDIPKHFRRTRN